MRIPLALFILLAACDASPAPQFMGVRGVPVADGGRDYVVYARDGRAEVVRLGYARAGQHQGIRDAMPGVIERATGCKVVAGSLTGDSGDMRARLSCPKGQP